MASGAIDHTFAVGLHAAGVETGFVGKYMNGAPASVPGWDSLVVQRETGESGAKGYTATRWTSTAGTSRTAAPRVHHHRGLQALRALGARTG